MIMRYEILVSFHSIPAWSRTWYPRVLPRLSMNGQYQLQWSGQKASLKSFSCVIYIVGLSMVASEQTKVQLYNFASCTKYTFNIDKVGMDLAFSQSCFSLMSNWSGWIFQIGRIQEFTVLNITNLYKVSSCKLFKWQQKIYFWLNSNFYLFS